MQMILMTFMVCVLAAAVVLSAVMGIRQHLRMGRLACAASERSMKFSPQDPFQVPVRYAEFALISAGHSPHADNVTYGRLGGVPVRAFDFRCEAGHGTRRMDRSYGVIVVESQAPVADLLMWNVLDAQAAPQACLLNDGRQGYWTLCGPAATADKVASCAGGLGPRGASLEFHRGSMMLCIPMRKPADSYMDWMEQVRGLIAALGLTIGDA
jgi:hypothetical protein